MNCLPMVLAGVLLSQQAPNELQQLRDEITALRKEVQELRADPLQGIRIYYGNVEIPFRKGVGMNFAKVVCPISEFEPFPTVLVSESGSAGTVVITKAEYFEPDKFQITVTRHSASRNVEYKALVAWFVIGKLKPGAKKPEEPKAFKPAGQLRSSRMIAATQ